jgi:hypothetical protein
MPRPAFDVEVLLDRHFRRLVHPPEQRNDKYNADTYTDHRALGQRFSRRAVLTVIRLILMPHNIFLVIHISMLLPPIAMIVTLPSVYRLDIAATVPRKTGTPGYVNKRM